MSLFLPSVLTIAGSDSSGGAGIQADLKTITALGLYGSSAITALTAQNTTGVYLTEAVNPKMLARQLEAVFSDIPPQAVKIGMAGNVSSIEVIADKLSCYPKIPVVLDPVMVSTSGGTLLQAEALKTLIERLFPLAALVTPNILETEVLLSPKKRLLSKRDMEEAASELSGKYQTAFLLKGGHCETYADDVLCHDGTLTWFPGKRIPTPNTHGTGCTLSSAIACGLAKGKTMTESIAAAKEYLNGALMAGLDLGKGSGPIWHGWQATMGETTAFPPVLLKQKDHPITP
ncbi:bifunctional hydroxymethylpyrimidine kinase/phosphomethylpyrimidine kinase [Lacrimispora sp. JR3]|uniref:bifunctional hydroxymethylpyrimidine kinase/phosphomethylpyrimidine kinase n=1 Tax=Lacrimispora sinapis TaxID=3111456 RepID=UPI00374A9249